MILPVEKEMELTDNQFDELMKDYDNALDEYAKDMLEDYLAFYLAKGYELSAIFENKLDIITYTAISLLEGAMKNLYNLDVVKKKLEENYKLRITNDDRLNIERI